MKLGADKSVIHKEYLPINFDAKPGNATTIQFKKGEL